MCLYPAYPVVCVSLCVRASLPARRSLCGTAYASCDGARRTPDAGLHGEVLKREWKILRDSLRQSLKKKRKGATTKSGLPCKKWRLESRMAFILPHMTVRRKYRQVKDTIKTDDAEVQSDQEQEAPAWDPRHTDQDALDLFFASACQSTRRLPRKYQNVVKRQILEVLMRVEDDFENDHNDNKSDVYKV
ncbi:uncharacterized protein [Epargyreus clarus]|uniref:uncharacterized protein isoform X2 n=1 Tax=Epargyreus clarus TaxID=520877 RepID=UPI003C2FDC4A